MVFFDSQINLLYNYIVDFLGNPTFYKIKDDDLYSFYGVQVFSDNIKEKLFLICKSIRKEYPELKLKDIPWYSFQTRKLTDTSEYDNLPKIHLKKNFMSDLKNVILFKTQVKNNIVEYKIPTNDRIIVSLLHSDEYYNPEQTNLQYLLNLFDCIIYIEKKQ